LGAESLSLNIPNVSSAICREDSHFAVLSKKDFDNNVKELHKNIVMDEIKALGNVPLLRESPFNFLKSIYLNSVF
jgi:hypothetical protein